jgi:hypothetical protein
MAPTAPALTLAHFNGCIDLLKIPKITGCFFDRLNSSGFSIERDFYGQTHY